MNQQKNLLCIAMALALSACGNSSPVATVVSTTTTTGKAVDGYLKDSLVVCDTNNNGLLDGVETSTTTNATGDFTFSPACASTIVVTGGTNIDTNLPFSGQLKAPAGSTVATPLTSLMVSGGLTAAQVATAMGLAPGTDVTKTDPVTIPDLLKKTLAVQQVIQQIANTMGSLAGTNTADSIQALYSQVAKSVSATLLTSAALIDGSGNVSPTVVTAIVKKSVENVTTSTDTNLSAAKTALTSFSATSVSELVGSPVAAQATALASFSGTTADLKTTTSTLQTNAVIANAAQQFSSLLTTAADSVVSLSTAATSLATLSITPADSTAQALLTSSIITQNSAAANVPSFVAAVTTAPPVVASNNVSIPDNSLIFSYANNNSVSQPFTLTQFKSPNGVALSALPDSISLAYTLNGTPIPVGQSGIIVGIGIEITQTTLPNTTRVLQLILDQLNLTSNAGTLGVSVPQGAQLFAYGKTGSGATANLTLDNTFANTLVTTGNGSLTINTKAVLAEVIAKANATQSNNPFANLLNDHGTFTLRFIVKNLSVVSDTAGAVEGMTLNMNNSTRALTGLGVSGKFSTP